jgi:hypothetical protein
MDPIAESLNPLGQPINRRVPPPFIEGARSQLVIRFHLYESFSDPYNIFSM